MNPSRCSSLFIILIFILTACSQNPISVVLDPQIAETQKLTFPASDVQAYGYFGNSVAIEGDLMVVGAFLTNGPTVNSFQGAAYLYQQDITGSWQFVKKLMASDSAANHLFGQSVAISGNTIVVGARGANAAYIFERDQGGTNAWGEVKKLVARDAGTNDSFGQSVAISGNTVVVGAYDDESGNNIFHGSAYVFSRNRGGTNAWGQVKKLLASGTLFFGYSVAISGNTVVVGSYGDNGIQGSAYIFERDQGGINAWGEVKKLVANDGETLDQFAFGFSVAISSNTIVVGVRLDDIGTTYNQGSAYIFERDQGGVNTWGEVKQLLASDGVTNDSFGESVAISGDVVVVGVPGRGAFRGRAYLYRRNGGGLNNWGQFRRLVASDRAKEDLNGSSVSISGNTAVVGAFFDDIGSNRDQGSSYIFRY